MATATLPPQAEAGPIAASPDDAPLRGNRRHARGEAAVNAYECELGSLLGQRLAHFLEANRLGRSLTEMLFDLRPAVTRSRRPDVAFLSVDRCPLHVRPRAPRRGA